MKFLRRFRLPINLFIVVFLAIWQIGQPLRAATYYWDADALLAGNNVDGTNLGGTGTWDTALLNWWDLANDIAWPNLATDQAIFTGAFAAFPTANTVSIDAGGVNANKLSFFRSGYTLSGDALTLTGGTPTFQANLGESAMINSVIHGSAGLTKTGLGSVRLANAGNDYTGTTTIGGGSLIIADQAALGASSTAIVVSGSQNRGFGGGQLVLDGGYSSGVVLSRDITLQGLGPVADRSAALRSVRTNTITGAVTTSLVDLALAPQDTAISSSSGLLTFSGTSTLNIGGVAGTDFTTFGVVNGKGVGGYAVNGTLTGSGSIQKLGLGTLLLSPSDATGFTGTIKVTAGTVRITSAAALGNNAGTVANSVIDLAGGTLEVRSDAPTIGKAVYQSNTSTLFVDHALGSSVINQTASFAPLRYVGNETLTFNGRNGYGMSFGTNNNMSADNANDVTFTNNLNGLLTFTGTIWNNGTNAANLVFSGTGNTLVTSNILATGGTGNNFFKQGTGTLTLDGTASTFLGNTNVQGGILAINDFRAINNNTTTINIGNTTTTGTLTIGTAATPTAAGLTTSKVINLAGSTGGATINASQSGVDPVVINANFTATGGNASQAKTVTLGGSNTADNIINGIIPNNAAGGTVNLRKFDAGTWVLAGTNSYTGTTTITQGTLKIKANAAVTSTVIADTGATTFNSNATTLAAGGTLEFLGFAGAATTENLGALTPTLGAGTVKLTADTGSPFATSLVFASLGTVAKGTGINFDTIGGSGGTVTVTGVATTTAITLPGNGHLYINGADFARSNGGVMVAPVYGTDAGFVNAAAGAATLTAANHNLITGNITAQTAIAISSLKLTTNTLNLSGLLTVHTTAVTTTDGGILQTGGTTAAISGTGITTGGTGGLVFRVNGSGDVLTLNAPITSTTTGGLTKNGFGTLVLVGANAQTGTTSINEGTIQLFGATTLSGANAALTIRQSGTLDLNGVSTGTAIGDFNGAGIIVNGVSPSTPAAATLTVGNGTGTGTFSGVMQDGTAVLNVTKTGTGAQTWSGANTYTGVTTIGSTGLVSLTTLADYGTASGIGRGIQTVVSDANNAASLVFTGTTGGIAYTGTTSVSIDRLFTLNGSAAGSGAQIVNNSTNNSTLILNKTNAITFGGAATVAQTLTLGGASTGDNRINQQIIDNTNLGNPATSVTKTGVGVWVLGNASNSYTGATTIISGALRAVSGTTLPTASNLVFNGSVAGGTPTGGSGPAFVAAVLETSGSFSRTLGTGSGQFQFSAPAANTANFRGGFAASDSKLTVNWGSTPIWGSTANFLDTRDGLTLSSATALSETLITSDFSLGTASGGAVTFTTVTAANADNALTALGVSTTAGLNVGQSISGTGIASGAYIISIDSATALRMSADTTAAIAVGTTSATVVANALRAIRVEDNTSTQTDFATITGIISGNAGTGIRKLGTGTLQLFGANNYSGETNVNQGTLVVNTLGLSTAVAAGTSVGINTGANLAAQAVTLGNGGTGAGILQYVGVGETSDRYIRLNTTTGSTEIHADGSGALVLTKVLNDQVAGAKTLFLRGSNTAGNTISSVLANNGGNLGVTVDSGATWILSGNNSYLGATTVTGGAFGLGNANGAGLGTLTLGSASFFAYGADRSLTQAVTQSNNTTIAFIGDYSVSLASTTYALAASANSVGSANTIVAGKTLTFGAVTANAMTAARTWTISGTGDTFLTGNITTSTAFNLNVTYSGTGSLSIGGTGSNWNAGTFTQTAGTVRLTNSEVIPDGAGKGNVTLNPAIGVTATFDLNGKNETINGLTANGAGTTVVDNTSGTVASLTFGANDATVDFGNGAGNYTITDSGAALSLTKTGAGVATISTGVALTYQGATSVTGGTLTSNSALNGSPTLSVTGAGSILALSGGVTTPATITSISVGNGATLNLLDGTGNKLSSLTTLSLGTAAGANTTLGFNVGDLSVAGDGLNTDTLSFTAAGTLTLFAGNKITFNLTDTGLNANQQYVLLDATAIGGGFTSGVLTIADYLLGATPGGFTSIDLTTNSTNNQIILTTGNLITGSLYWRGLTDNTWNGNVNNWSTDKAGTLPTSSIPGQGTDVIFQWDAPSNAAVTTTLEQNFKINSLTLEAATVPADTPASVTINPGTVTTSRLEIAPQVATDGIKITTGGPVAVNIVAPLKIGAAQTWGVAGATTVLTLSGGLQGEGDVTKNGLGKVTVSAAAAAAFNTGLTTDVSIIAGTFEITNTGALGSVANANLANVAINGGAFYYNGAAGTVANNLTLGGGTLSAGTAAQTYSGTVNASADSDINLRDANSATLTTTQRNITLSGVISGGGKITLDSINTVTAGNQLTGTLTLSNANPLWSGGLALTRGSVTASNVAALGTGNITASAGRISFTAAGGNAYNLAQNITVDAAGGILELNANASGTPVTDMNVNLSGVITIGSLTNANNALRITQDADNFSIVNITNSIVLGNNASLSYQGSATRPLVISAVISDGGSNYSLAINDELGVWAVTSRQVNLTNANSYGGGTTLTEGTLGLGNKSALGTGTLTITGASNLTATVDLSGANTVANAMTLGADVTVTGANNLTIGGTFTGTGADADRTLTNNITGPAKLILSGVTMNLGDAANLAARTLTFTGTGETEITNGLIDGNAFANILSKTGAGSLTLNGAGSYTGGSTLSGGTLILGDDSALGTADLTATAASTVQAGSARALANNLVLNSATAFSLTLGGSNTLAFNGNVSQSGNNHTITVANSTLTTFGDAASDTLTLAENDQARTLTLNVGAGGLTINSTIQDGTGTGADSLIKSGAGTMTLNTSNTYTGTTGLQNGATVLAGGAANRLPTTTALTLGTGANSATLQLGDGAGASDQTLTSLATSGSGTSNAIVGGNATFSTLTVNQSSNTTYAGNLGGAGANENNLNFVKDGVGNLIVSGTSTYTGTTTVTAGKLLIDSTTGFPATNNTSLTVADGAEFSLRGSGLLANQTYGFAGAGNVITVGSGAGTAVLGFRVDGAFNTQLQLTAGQTMSVAAGSTFQTAVYVAGPPTVADYILIDGADPNSLAFGGGAFDFNPVIFNGGSFTYSLNNDTGGGSYDHWVLTATALPAPADVWWKGDLTGIAAGVWSASLTSGTGFPTNWDDSQSGATDAVVPPDSGSIVHFSADGAANFATTLGGNLTIQELIFEAGGTAVSVGGANTLTIGNTVDSAGITLKTGAPNASFSAGVKLAQAQSFNITDNSSVLTFTGALSGTGALSINDNGSSTGTMVLAGAGGLATYSGGTNLVTGRLILQGGASNRLPTAGALTMGNATLGATLQLGDSINGPGNTTIGSLGTGAATSNAIVGGFSSASTLTVFQTSAGTFEGVIGGGGSNENQVGITKEGAATLILNGANTYTGATTVRNGILQMGASGSINGTTSLVVNANAGVTAALDVNGRTVVLGGTITLGGADNTATANIIDTATGGLLTLGGAITYDATNNPLGSTINAKMTTAAARTITVNDSSSTTTELTLNGTLAAQGGITIAGAGNGVINGAWTLTTGNLSNTFNSTGTWTINAATNTTGTGDWVINSGVINATVANALNAADDVIIDGTGIQDSAIVNISGVGVHGGDDFFIRNGGRVNVNVNNGISTGTSTLLIGDSASASVAAAGRLNLAANMSTNTGGIQLGGAGGNIGNITGAGTITTSGPKSLRNGSIATGITLAGSGDIIKVSDGTVTYSGASTGTGATAIQEGNLVLDYTVNNASKIGGVLTFGAAQGNLSAPTKLTINANAAGTTQSVTSTTLGNTGNVIVDINDAGAATTLALGAITRPLVGATVSFDYSSANAVATTTSPATGALGWATVTTGGTTRIASISAGGQIVQAATTSQNDVTMWETGDNVINTGAFTGTVGDCNTIGSLTFDAAVASTVTVGSGKTLIITSGGILVNSTVGANASTITGGSLLGATSAPLGELVVHQDNAAGSLTINSNIISSSGITKSGVGTLVLGGSNTFLSGSRLTINEGSVRVAGGNAIGDSTLVLMRSGATLDLNGTNEAIGNLGVDATNFSSGTIALGGGTLTINQSVASTYAGVFTSTAAGKLIKSGAGTLTSSAASTGFLGTLQIDQGQVSLSTNGITNFNQAAAVVLNGTGSLRLIFGNANTADRIKNTATVTLSNTIFGTGYAVANSDNATQGEVAGALTLAAGHNLITSEATSIDATTTQNATLTFASLAAVNNGATALVRGNNLGSATTLTSRGRITFTAAPTGSLVAVGGGGAAASTTISIFPYFVGQTGATGTVMTTMLGNSFVMDQGAAGLRPLDLTTEYVVDSAAPATGANNVRYTADNSITTPAAINSLVLDSATGVALTGSAASMEITSGAILAAGAGTAHSISGFTGLTSGATPKSYYVYVTDPLGVLTLNTPLTSAAGLIKSGAGALVLTSASNAFTDITMNQGVVQADDLDKLGTGTLRFFGGGLKLAAGWTDDLSSKTLDINTGGGTIDVSLVTAGTSMANGIDDSTANAADTLNLITRSTGATGVIGQLTIQGASSYTGTTIIRNTSLDSGLINSVVLNGSSSTINGNLEIGDATNVDNTFDAVLALGASDQIVDSARITFRGAAGENAYFKLLGFNETIAGIVDTTGQGVIENRETETVTGSGTLTLDSSLDFSYNGALRDVDNGAADTDKLILVKQGAGTQTLSGGEIRHSGSTTVSGGALTLTDVTNWQSDITNNATLNLNQTTGSRTHGNTINGSGVLNKIGAGTVALGGANGYSGLTNIEQGTLSISASNNLGDASATNTIRIANAGTLQNTGANVDLTVNRTIALAGASANIEVTGANILTVPGLISGDDCTPLFKTGTGTLLLSAANTYSGSTTISGGTLDANTLADGGNNSSIGSSTAAASNLVLNGGTLKYTGTGGSSNREFTLGTAGGTLDSSGIGALDLTSTAAVALSGTNTPRTLTLRGSNTGQNTLAAAVGDNGTGATSLVKDDASTWIVSGTNTYSGTTAVNNGNLQVGSGGVGSTGTGDLTVAAPGTLSGRGTVEGTGTHTVSGTVRPGDYDVTTDPTTNGVNAGAGVGTLGVKGNLTFVANSSAFFQIGDPSSAYDQIKGLSGGGTVTLDSNLTIVVNRGGLFSDFFGGYSPVDGDAWTLLDWATINLNGFVPTSSANLDLPDVSGAGLKWDVSLFGSAGKISVKAVPEPGRMLLLAFGLATLALRRRRRPQA